MKKKIYYAAMFERGSFIPMFPMCCKGSKNVRHLRAEIRKHCKNYTASYYRIWTTDRYGEVLIEHFYRCGISFINKYKKEYSYDSVRTNCQP